MTLELNVRLVARGERGLEEKGRPVISARGRVAKPCAENGQTSFLPRSVCTRHSNVDQALVVFAHVVEDMAHGILVLCLEYRFHMGGFRESRGLGQAGTLPEQMGAGEARSESPSRRTAGTLAVAGAVVPVRGAQLCPSLRATPLVRRAIIVAVRLPAAP